MQVVTFFRQFAGNIKLKKNEIHIPLHNSANWEIVKQRIEQRRPGWLDKEEGQCWDWGRYLWNFLECSPPPGLKLAAKYGRGPRFRGRPETGSTTNRRPEGQQAGRCAGANSVRAQISTLFSLVRIRLLRGTRFLRVTVANMPRQTALLYPVNQNACPFVLTSIQSRCSVDGKSATCRCFYLFIFWAKRFPYGWRN